MPTSFAIFVQYCCPQHTLTRLTGWLAECRWPWFKNWAIKRLIRKYQVDLSIASSQNLDDYPTFNSFFTRTLKPEARPVVSGLNQIASPVDGCVSQMGRIHQDKLFQAKNFYFNLATLLGNVDDTSDLFREGYFATLYLAPRDYHRVHMPISGTLFRTIYVPGKLFSVNQATAAAVPNLFARNERLICLFHTLAGPMAVIFVGAMLVGSIRTVFDNHLPTRKISVKDYSDGISLERGAELGHFKMGSTIILLFAKDCIEWQLALQENATVCMGEWIGDTRKV